MTTNIYLGIDLHPGQLSVFNSPARFRVVCCGRRWGKSEELKAEILKGVKDQLRIAYMCPTYKMLAEMWRAVKNLLAPITREKKEDEHRIETINGAIVEMWSLDNPDSPRGREYDLVLIDEAAMIPSGDAWQQVIRPMLMTTRGRALFASTPRGYNWFWNLWKLGELINGMPRQAGWESWQLPSINNPHLPPAEIEEARQISSALTFSQEYEAEFISDSGAVFRNIDKQAIGIWQEKPMYADHTYVIGVDLAKANDFSVFMVIDVTFNSLCYIERDRHVDYKIQKGRLTALANRFHAAGVIVEQNTNLAFMEELMDTGLPIIPFTTGGNTKAMIIEALAAAFDNERLILPDRTNPYALYVQQLLDELHAFQMERLPSGNFRYGGPRDMHDDMVMALALAWYGAYSGVPKWKPELIEIAQPSQTVSTLNFLFGPVQAPKIEDGAVAWPTAEYIFQ